MVRDRHDIIHQTIKEILKFTGKDVHCYRLFLLLKEIYPDAVAYYTGVPGHIVTMIEGDLWDKDGLYLYQIDKEPYMKKRIIKAMKEIEHERKRSSTKNKT